MPRDFDRIAEVIPPPPLELPLDQLPQDSPMRKTFTSPPPNAEAANTVAWRQADLGALNGHGNARSLARTLSAVALGGKANGVRLVHPDTIEQIFSVQSDGVDQVLGVPLRWGVGYGLPKPETIPYLPDEKICFWGGWGGSMVLIDPDRRSTVAYVMNKMGPGVLGSERTAKYTTLIYQALS